MNALAVMLSRERFYEQSRQEFEEIVRTLDSDEA
jgi:exonuclease VII small subunit